MASAASILFFTLVTGARRSLSLKLSDTSVYEPPIRACLGTTAHFCEVDVLVPFWGLLACLVLAAALAPWVLLLLLLLDYSQA